MLKKSGHFIDYNTPVLSVGSCFAFELYKKIKSGGFKSLHPGGVIYNPISISKHLNNAISAHTYGEKTLSPMMIFSLVGIIAVKTIMQIV